MKILHLSDTHSCHRRLRDLSEADVVVHSGDFTMTGSEAEAIDFLNWFCDLPYRQKIFICGNHDAYLYGASIDGLDDNVHYLCNTSIEIEDVKFYGVPMFMEDCVTDCQKRNYNTNYGSEELLERISAIHLKAHLFGHIHVQHGILKQQGMIFSNGAIMNVDYSNLNSPNLIEI